MTSTVEQAAELDRGTTHNRVATQHSILFIIDQLTELGGAERMLFELARRLPSYGYRVSILTLRSNPHPDVCSLTEGITILPLRSCFSVGAIRAAFQLRRLIREQQADIVQTYFESSDLFGAIVSRLSGVTHICSSRRDMGILRSAKHRLVYRALAPLYGAVFAVSSKVAEWHGQQDKISSPRMHTIQNGVDIAQFDRSFSIERVRTLLNLPATSPLITTISNINTWKGLDVFLNAASEIQKQLPDAIFAIAGDRTDQVHYDELLKQADALGIRSSVFFLGHVQDTSSLLRASDLFLLLSHSEGFPNVVIEAMAARLPVIATNVGGTSEALVDQLTGFLVEDGDYLGAAKKAVSLLTNSNLSRSMGSSGRLYVEQHFSLEQMVRKHVEVYDALFIA